MSWGRAVQAEGTACAKGSGGRAGELRHGEEVGVAGGGGARWRGTASTGGGRVAGPGSVVWAVRSHRGVLGRGVTGSLKGPWLLCK